MADNPVPAAPQEAAPMATPEPRACKYCGSTLPSKAIFCKECSRYQTLKATFLNSVNFGTLAASVPILTLCWAFLHDRVLFPDSDMAVSVLRCSTDHIELAVANTGSRPGVIGRGMVSQRIGPTVKAERDLMVANREKAVQSVDVQSSSIIIAPAQSTVLQMQVIRKNWPEAIPERLAETSEKNCEYHVAVDIVDFGKTTPSSKLLKPCRCPGT